MTNAKKGHKDFTSKPRSREEILAAIKKASDLIGGQAPGVKTLRPGMYHRALQLFGSWENAVKAATGLPTQQHAWSEKEVREKLTVLRDQLGHIPTHRECKDLLGKKFLSALEQRFGTFCDALETVFGQSPRTDVLEAVAQLVTGPVNECSTPEVVQALRKNGKTYTLYQVGQYCSALADDGFLSGGRGGRRIALYTLTPKGAQHKNAVQIFPSPTAVGEGLRVRASVKPQSQKGTSDANHRPQS